MGVCVNVLTFKATPNMNSSNTPSVVSQQNTEYIMNSTPHEAINLNLITSSRSRQLEINQQVPNILEDKFRLQSSSVNLLSVLLRQKSYLDVNQDLKNNLDN